VFRHTIDFKELKIKKESLGYHAMIALVSPITNTEIYLSSKILSVVILGQNQPMPEGLSDVLREKSFTLVIFSAAAGGCFPVLGKTSVRLL
jgi:hypothetical protein